MHGKKTRAVLYGEGVGLNALIWVMDQQSIHLFNSELSTAKERREARLFLKCRILVSCQLALYSLQPSLLSALLQMRIES